MAPYGTPKTTKGHKKKYEASQVTHKPKRDYGRLGGSHHMAGGGGGEAGVLGGNPWYQPPPISPDLPPLFYDDANKDGKVGTVDSLV